MALPQPARIMIPRSRIATRPGMWTELIAALATGRDPGPHRVAAFERDLARYVGVRHAVATSTGRAAMRLGLGALGLPAGGEILVPAYTHGCMPDACRAVGLRPVLVDVRASDHNIDPALAAKAIGPDTVAILATHILGRPCDLAALTDLADQHGLVLVEDAAHALGAAFDGRPTGSWGRIAALSFATTKPLHAIGGGALLTDDDDVADRVRTQVRDGGAASRGALARRVASMLALQGVAVGTQRSRALDAAWRAVMGSGRDPQALYRTLVRPGLSNGSTEVLGMHGLQAEIGQGLLAGHTARCDARRAHEARLATALDGARPILVADTRARAVPIALTIVADDADHVAAALLQRGLDTARELAHDISDGACPVAARAAACSVFVPVYPQLGPDLPVAEGALRGLGGL